MGWGNSLVVTSLDPGQLKTRNVLGELHTSEQVTPGLVFSQLEIYVSEVALVLLL